MTIHFFQILSKSCMDCYKIPIFGISRQHKNKMEQRIDHLSAEQIGKIFPIEVVPYRKQWETLYNNEKELIVHTLGNLVEINIEHIGSTSVYGISAKPIIDILIEIPLLTSETKKTITPKLREINYENMSNAEQEKRMTYGKGYDLHNPKKQKFHLHVREKCDDFQDEIYFRDYLRQNSDALKKYEILKTDLAENTKIIVKIIPMLKQIS